MPSINEADARLETVGLLLSRLG